MKSSTRANSLGKLLKRDSQLILLSLPAVIIVFIFSYLPLYGIIMSFQNYSPALGFAKSPWIGLENFRQFFSSMFVWRIIRNTVVLGFLTLVFTFPAPIILALLLNEVRATFFKKLTQTISYLPSFLSIVTIIGVIQTLTYKDAGAINIILSRLGFQKILFLSSPGWFRPLYIISGIWSGVGIGSIIYLASIAGVDVQLYDAAFIDGAGRWRQMVHVTLPSIAPTVTILLILSISGIVSNDFIKVLILQNPITYETSDVISTYVYREGLEGARYSYGAAVGLLNTVVAFLLTIIANAIARRFSEYSLY